MTRKKKIIWDMDEVIVNLRDVVCGPVARYMRAETDWRTWTDYQSFHKHLGDKGIDASIQALIATGAIEIAEPEPDALITLALMKSLGFENEVVTARGWHPGARYLTIDWLTEHGMYKFINDLHIVDVTGPKYQVIQKIGHAEYFVEDSSMHILDAVLRCNIDTIVAMNRPWNTSSKTIDEHPKIVRVNNLKEFGDMVCRKHGGALHERGLQSTH